MQQELKQIMERLDHMENDLHYIKKHLTDGDLVLTEDDLEALKDAENDFKQSKTKRLI